MCTCRQSLQYNILPLLHAAKLQIVHYKGYFLKRRKLLLAWESIFLLLVEHICCCQRQRQLQPACSGWYLFWFSFYNPPTKDFLYNKIEIWTTNLQTTCRFLVPDLKMTMTAFLGFFHLTWAYPSLWTAWWPGWGCSSSCCCWWSTSGCLWSPDGRSLAWLRKPQTRYTAWHCCAGSHKLVTFCLGSWLFQQRWLEFVCPLLTNWVQSTPRTFADFWPLRTISILLC